MTSTCHDHGHAVVVAEINTQLVFYGATRLDNTTDASRMSNLHAIREWKESVTCHDSSLQIKVKGLRLVDSLV